MPIIGTQTDTGSNPNYTVGGSNQNIYILSSAVVMCGSSTAFNVGSFGSVGVYNNGAIIGYYGIATSGILSTIFNASSGLISSTITSITINQAADAALINNSGTIVSNYLAISIAANNCGVDNSGMISAYNGIYIGAANAFIRNAGTINAQNLALYMSDQTSTAEIVNTGLIVGGAYAIQTYGSVVIHNSGSISGEVLLQGATNVIDGYGGSIIGRITGGAGVDTFDLRHMTVIGTIAGGLGADTITGTADGDVIYGDTISGGVTGGADTLSGGYGDDAIYGGYGADAIMGNQGDDILYGNQDNDWMHGGQGDDMLYGGQGNDVLNGGVGDDTLYGNVGFDIFAVGAKFGHDLIGDFGVVAGNSDTITFVPGTFNSYADVAAHMVQSGNVVVLTLDDANSITFANMTVAALTADHFVFG